MTNCDSKLNKASSKGYPRICVNGKRMLLHVYVWESVNGPKPKGYHIHHKDENKGNPDISNLELLLTSHHKKIHQGWVRDSSGVFIAKPCRGCEKVLPLDQFYDIKTRNGKSSLCKICHNEFMGTLLNSEEGKIHNKAYLHERYRQKKIKSGGLKRKIYIKINNEIDTLSSWAIRLGISHTTFLRQYHKGLYERMPADYVP